jgi:hypothetical protein
MPPTLTWTSLAKTKQMIQGKKAIILEALGADDHDR